MLRCERRDPLILKAGFWRAECIADGIQAGIKNTDDIAGVCLAEDLPVACHQLLRLGQPLDPSALNVLDIHSDVVLARTDADKSDPVSVGLVHIGLDLEDKSGKLVFYGIDRSLVRHAGRRRGRHLQEMLKEDLNAEVVESGAEKYRRQLSCPDRFDIEVRACAV